MRRLNLTWEQYGLLPVEERAIYVVRDHMQEWFQALVDDARVKEMEAHAKRSKSHSASAAARRS